MVEMNEEGRDLDLDCTVDGGGYGSIICLNRRLRCAPMDEVLRKALGIALRRMPRTVRLARAIRMCIRRIRGPSQVGSCRRIGCQEG